MGATMFTTATAVADWVLILPVVLSLLGGATLLMLRSARDFQWSFAFAVTAGVLTCDLLLLARTVTAGPLSMTMGNWLPPFGISFTADTLSATFAAAAAVLTLLILVYLQMDVPERARRDGVYPLVLLLLGGLCMVLAVAYTGGPFPYGYRGLGELAVFLTFGVLAVAGTAYLQTGSWTTLAFAAAIPPGCLVTAILVVNNLLDIEPDRRAGKVTLAVRFGARFARMEYLVLLVAACAVPPLLLATGTANLPVLLPLLTIPTMAPLVHEVFADGDPRRLNPVLGGTAHMALRFCTLFAIGLALDGLVRWP